MHELSLIREVLNQIEFLAMELHSHKVAGVKLQFGALIPISAESFRKQFARVARSTVAEGARLDIETMHDATHRHACSIVLENVEIAD